ncbi:hypothetical protein E4656_09170 [Natronospirillum operosum]|uniref:DSBA-like thioredoxin domain-containing protein n=1 Tax=Natronospirillum operosum TaxID=2759953 RepID=A0A4Z0WE64_9GAMM|nr:DsbA family protein [Natronospirillum operosum]TGG93221.1 hypothetical protein E4656_09170 [Natronospirillum operosum]
MKPFNIVLLMMLVLLAACASAPAQRDQVRQDYPQQADPDRDEVMVFFGYQCGPCHQFYEQELTHWLTTADDNVDTLLVPVVFSSSVEAAARGFHAAELMGANPDFHRSIFVAFQSNPERVATAEQVIELAGHCCGLDQEEFRRLYESEAVDRRMRQAETLTRGHGISMTPSVMVNRELVLDPYDVQMGERLIDLVDNALQGDFPSGRGI